MKRILRLCSNRKSRRELLSTSEASGATTKSVGMCTNEGKEPQLHPGMLPGACLKHPRNTEPIAGEETYAKGEGRRMQIVHPQIAGQHHQHAHVHEGGEPPATA